MSIRHLKLFSLFFVSLLISYFFVLDNDFLGDDVIRIVSNPELDSLYFAMTGKLGDRPLLMLLMFLEKQIFGLNPLGFKIINLAIHSLAGFQLYKLIMELSPSVDAQKSKVAFLVALLFVLHPLHNQSLNVVIQIGVIIAGILGMISLRYLFKWLNEGFSKHAFISVFSLFLAFFFKPIVSFLPFLYLYVVLSNKGTDKKYLKIVPLYFLSMLVPVVFYLSLNKNVQENTASPIFYFLTQLEVVFTYFKLILLPINLKYLYDFTPPTEILSVNLLYLVAHAVLIFTGIKTIKNKLRRYVFVAFYISFLPESGFFPIQHLAFEHRTFFPLVFVFLFAGLKAIDLQVWKMKATKTITASLICIYLILNQARNFQIKPFGNWMLHSIENSHSHHDFNSSFAILLLKMNQTESLKPVFELYKQRYPNSLAYQTLDAIYQYYLHPERKRESYQLVGENLKKGAFLKTQRKYINIYLIQQINADGTALEDLIILEKALANQLPYFFRDYDTFDEIISFYQRFSHNLLSPRLIKDPALFTKEYEAGIRKNLCSYYKDGCLSQ